MHKLKKILSRKSSKPQISPHPHLSLNETKSPSNGTFPSSTPTDRPWEFPPGSPVQYPPTVTVRAGFATIAKVHHPNEPADVAPLSFLHLGHQSIALIWNSPQRSIFVVVVVFATYRESPNPHLAFLFLRRNATHLGRVTMVGVAVQRKSGWCCGGGGGFKFRPHSLNFSSCCFFFFLLSSAKLFSSASNCGLFLPLLLLLHYFIIWLSIKCTIVADFARKHYSQD